MRALRSALFGALAATLILLESPGGSGVSPAATSVRRDEDLGTTSLPQPRGRPPPVSSSRRW